MVSPKIGNFETLLITFLYLSTGYISLLLAYWLQDELDIFFDQNSPDKIIQTFVVGSFSLIVLTTIIGTPNKINFSNIWQITFFLGGVTLINSLSISIIRNIETQLRKSINP